MKLSKFILSIFCFSVLTGCAGGNIISKDSMIDTDSMIDKELFIKQSEKRSEAEVKFGPILADGDDKKLREAYRKLIHKEESLDYVKLTEGEDGKPPFSISVNVENMDIRTFMHMLSKVTGVNMLVSEEVKGNVTARLENVPWPSVLNSVLSMKKLAKNVDKKANIIRIHDQTTIVQLEDFERKRMENLQRDIMLERASEPLYTEIFKLFYSKPDVMKKMLEDILGVHSKGGGKGGGLRSTTPEITIDERKNYLIVKARKSDIETVSTLINEIDSRTEQVFIEAFIVEVTDGFEKELGARLGLNGADGFGNVVDNKAFNGRVTGLGGVASSSVSAGDSGAVLSNLGATSPFGGIGLLGGVGSAADLKLELTAMEAEGLTKVISNPRVFTLDNQEATIFQGDEVPYETTSQDGTKIEFKEAGLKLAVTPGIIGDGNLMMDIVVNKDTVDTTLPNPPITKSEVKTNLISKDGSIVVIGGIYVETKADSTDKVPGLGDVPGLGKFFRRDKKQDDRRELMIFIAPRIL